MKFGTTRTLLRAGKGDHREGPETSINTVRWDVITILDFLEETAGISFYITIRFLHLQFKCKNYELFILVSPEGLIFNQVLESCVGVTFRYTNLLLSPLTEPQHTCNIQSSYKRVWGFGFWGSGQSGWCFESDVSKTESVRIVSKLYNYVNFNQTVQKCVHKCLSQSPHFLTHVTRCGVYFFSQLVLAVHCFHSSLSFWAL